MSRTKKKFIRKDGVLNSFILSAAKSNTFLCFRSEKQKKVCQEENVEDKKKVYKKGWSA